jgi:hypothetical protein
VDGREKDREREREISIYLLHGRLSQCGMSPDIPNTGEALCVVRYLDSVFILLRVVDCVLCCMSVSKIHTSSVRDRYTVMHVIQASFYLSNRDISIVTPENLTCSPFSPVTQLTQPPHLKSLKSRYVHVETTAVPYIYLAANYLESEIFLEQNSIYCSSIV